MLSTRYSGQILVKYQFSQQICEKSLNKKIHENPSSGSRDCSMRTDWRTEGQTGMTNLIVS